MSSDKPASNSATMSPLDLIRGVLGDAKFIIVGVLACAIVAAVVAWLLPNQYESSAVLLLQPSPFREVPDKPVQGQPVGLFPKVLGVRDYAVLLTSDGVLQKVVERVRQEGKLSEEALDERTRPSRLRKSMSVVTTVVEKTAYSSTFSPVITLSVTGPSPEFAQVFAAAWAAVSVGEAQTFFKKGKGGQQEFLEACTKAAKEEVDRVLAEIEKVESKYEPESSKMRLSDMTTLLTTIEEEYYTVCADLETARQETADLTAQLTQLSPKVTLMKSPPATALFLEKSLGAKPQGDAAQEGGLRGYQAEEVNPTYTEASNLLVTAQKNMKGLEERKRTIEASMAKLRQDIETERTQIAANNREYKRLSTEAEVFRRNYGDLAERVEQAKIADIDEQNLADIKVASDAVVPDEKVAPNRKQIVFGATVLGLFVFVVISVFRGLLSAPK